VGWPGSVFDSVVFESSDICRNPEKYFSRDQYLLADAGYAGKWFICVPYKSPEGDLPHNKLFNELFSRARVSIEHVNGILKGRFSSLKGIRIQVKKVEHFKDVCEHIIVCLILHNLLIDFNDEWEEEEEAEDEEDSDSDADSDVDENDILETGQQLRARVRNFLLCWHFDNR
jgi:hypothetical protein